MKKGNATYATNPSGTPITAGSFDGSLDADAPAPVAFITFERVAYDRVPVIENPHASTASMGALIDDLLEHYRQERTNIRSLKIDFPEGE